jgi:hypothetical protein
MSVVHSQTRGLAARITISEIIGFAAFVVVAIVALVVSNQVPETPFAKVWGYLELNHFSPAAFQSAAYPAMAQRFDDYDRLIVTPISMALAGAVFGWHATRSALRVSTVVAGSLGFAIALSLITLWLPWAATTDWAKHASSQMILPQHPTHLFLVVAGQATFLWAACHVCGSLAGNVLGSRKPPAPALNAKAAQ